MEPSELLRITSEFRDFCKINLQLAENTTYQHWNHITRFLEYVGKRPQDISQGDIQRFLAELKTNPNRILKRKVETVSTSKYCNFLKSLRIFWRDFMDNGSIIKSFKFPKKTFEFRVNVPTKRQLQAFYSVLETPMEKAVFLFYCTTGLRRKEVLRLRMQDVDFAQRMVIPKSNCSRTKHTGITFYNGETETVLKEYLLERNGFGPEALLFPTSDGWIQRVFYRAKTKSGIRLSPQVLREWFSTELGSLKVPDRFIDFFSGRVPNSVLARHYTDFSPDRLKEIYDKAELKVLS